MLTVSGASEPRAKKTGEEPYTAVLLAPPPGPTCKNAGLAGCQRPEYHPLLPSLWYPVRQRKKGKEVRKLEAGRPESELTDTLPGYCTMS